MAAADVAISQDDVKKAENQVALQVHSVYYGILIAKLQKQAAEQQTRYADENLRESEDDVRNGNALKVTTIQGRATVLESQQSALTADLQLSDLTTELNDSAGASARHSARSGRCCAGGVQPAVTRTVLTNCLVAESADQGC